MRRSRSGPFVFLISVVLLVVAGGAVRLLRRLQPPEPLTRQEQLDKDLVTAVYDGDVVGVTARLKAGADPNARGYWDREGRWDEVRHRRVWDPHPDPGGPSALMLSVFSGSRASAVVLIGKGADVNAVDAAGNSALMWACLYGAKDIVRLLLEHGATVRLNKGGEDPLEYGAELGDPRLVRMMLARGSKIEEKDSSGETPLLRAAEIADAPMVRLLLQEGADIDAHDNDGDTTLILAVHAGMVEDRPGITVVPIRGSPTAQSAVVRLLLSQRADVRVRNKSGRTALQIATQRSLPSLISMLKGAGALE
jgi:ankyrin repeat protein